VLCGSTTRPCDIQLMAWVKIPEENHPLFHASLPRDPQR
jgi:hypothetical protein